MRTKLFALVTVVGMVGMAAGPGVAAAAASDSGNAAANEPLTVSVDSEYELVKVTKNGSGVANATVDVVVAGDGNYSGTGTYATNEKGAVMLDSPKENVTIDVTASADDETASTTATLTVRGGVHTGEFGASVSDFVHSLKEGNVTGIGQEVAEFVTANNPGNAPDHAGPPEHAGSGDENESVNETNGGNGPPEHAGNDKGNGSDKDRGNDKGNANGNGNGGGPSDDDSDDTEAE